VTSDFVTTGQIDGGKLHVRNRKAFDEAMASMKDGEVIVKIERARATRSAAMNRLYWGVYVSELSAHTGFTPDEMHEVLKAKFLPKKLAVTTGNGEIVGEFVIGGTTTRLDKIQFGDYLREIKQWADSLGVVIPEPEDQ